MRAIVPQTQGKGCCRSVARTWPLWEKTQRADMPVKTCHTLKTLPLDPHLNAVGLLKHEDHPTEGKTMAIRSTISSDDAYPSPGTFSQPRGRETFEVLEEIGYFSIEIEQLLAEHAVVASTSNKASPLVRKRTCASKV